MILDQNTIVLNPANGYYDEYTFDRYYSTGKILPGAVVGQTNVDLLVHYNQDSDALRAECKNRFPFVKYPFDEIRDTGVALEKTELAQFFAQKPLNDSRFGAFADRYIHVITAGAPAGATVDADYLDGVELHILVENALIGKSINHLFFPGEKTPVYTPVQGDRFLVRVEAGDYKEGDPLYLVNHTSAGGPTGFYFAGKGFSGTKSTEIKAYAAESFFIPETGGESFSPFPIYFDAIDDSTTERPSSLPLNGALVNLLRVRIA